MTFDDHSLDHTRRVSGLLRRRFHEVRDGAPAALRDTDGFRMEALTSIGFSNRYSLASVCYVPRHAPETPVEEDEATTRGKLQAFSDLLDEHYESVIATPDGAEGLRLVVLHRRNTLEELMPVILRPARPRLQEASAMLADVREEEALFRQSTGDDASCLDRRVEYDVARSACETAEIRELVPTSWFSEPGRTFSVLCPQCKGGWVKKGGQRTMCLACKGSMTRPIGEIPESGQLAELLASDIDNVRIAEQLALEAVRAMSPWGEPQVQSVCWSSTVKTNLAMRSTLTRQRGPVFLQMATALYGEHTEMRLLDHEPGELLHDHALRIDVLMHAAFAAASHDAEPVARGAAQLPGRHAMAQVLYNELTNPFRAILGIWRLGYVFDGVADGVAHLFCPINRGTRPDLSQQWMQTYEENVRILRERNVPR